MTDLFRVPKHTVRVEIWTPQRGTEQVDLFLSERAEAHAGQERPSDLLNRSEEFLAIRDETGEIAFLRPASTTIVTVAAEHEIGKEPVPAELLADDLATELQIAVCVEDGGVLSGTVRYELPEAQSRLQDFLNAKEPFLPLHRGDRVSFINKLRITRVTRLGEEEVACPWPASTGSSKP